MDKQIRDNIFKMARWEQTYLPKEYSKNVDKYNRKELMKEIIEFKIDLLMGGIPK